MKIYKAQRLGSLMVVKAYIKGPEAIAYPRMLLYTGSVVTIVAQEILESVGCSPASASLRQTFIQSAFARRQLGGQAGRREKPAAGYLVIRIFSNAEERLYESTEMSEMW